MCSYYCYICVSYYYYMCPHAPICARKHMLRLACTALDAMCVRILLVHMCPRATVYVVLMQVLVARSK
jgi:hypothetical protein